MQTSVCVFLICAAPTFAHRQQTPTYPNTDVLPPELRAWGVRRLGTERLDALLRNSTTVETRLVSQFRDWTLKGAPPVVFHMSGLDNPQKLISDLIGGGPNASYNLSFNLNMSTLVEVGANVGISTILAWLRAAASHLCLRVLAVEPTPETFLFLKWNLHANRVRESARCGVTALNLAVGAKAGATTITVVDEWSSMNARTDESSGLIDPEFVAWRARQSSLHPGRHFNAGRAESGAVRG